MPDQSWTVALVLDEARRLIVDPIAWTHEAYARDVDGESVSPCSEAAVCFCSLGAIKRALQNLGADSGHADGHGPVEAAAREALRRNISIGERIEIGGGDVPIDVGGLIAEWNDRHALHADVLRAFAGAFTTVLAAAPQVIA